MRFLAAVLAGGLLFAALPARAADPVAYVLLKAGTLIDGTGGAPKRGVDVLVKDGIIEKVGEGLAGPTGPDECRKAVRYAHKHGAGVIKIMSTGGVLSAGDALSARQFSDEELHAIVDEATLLGLKVCCHAHGAAGIKAAVRAGVASIEHGTF